MMRMIPVPSFRFLWLFCGLMAIMGCAEVTPEGTPEPTPAQRSLIGKTKQVLLACAGSPVTERSQGDQVMLIYYREASQFEESFAGSKGSFARVHHGCRATIIIEEDRIREMRYEGEPNSYRDQDHCEDIFEPCISP